MNVGGPLAVAAERSFSRSWAKSGILGYDNEAGGWNRKGVLTLVVVAYLHHSIRPCFHSLRSRVAFYSSSLVSHWHSCRLSIAEMFLT